MMRFIVGIPISFKNIPIPKFIIPITNENAMQLNHVVAQMIEESMRLSGNDDKRENN